MTRMLIAVASLLTYTALSVFVSPPASAHDRLISTTPSENENLTSAPSDVRLSFGSPPMEVGATVLVVGHDGRDYASGELAFQGNDVVVPVKDLATDSFYQVRWRVVSGDGHVINGAFSFSVGDENLAVPLPELEGANAARSGDERADSNEDAGDASRLGVIGIAGAVAALLLYLGAISTRRRINSSKESPL